MFSMMPEKGPQPRFFFFSTSVSSTGQTFLITRCSMMPKPEVVIM